MTTAPTATSNRLPNKTIRAEADLDDDVTDQPERSTSTTTTASNPSPLKRTTMQALELDDDDDDDDVLEEAEFEADNEPSSHPKRQVSHSHNRHGHPDQDKDDHHHHHHNNNSDSNDLQGLLSGNGNGDDNNGTSSNSSSDQNIFCSRVGNMTIFVPRVWLARTKGWGMMGPHWFGPLTIAVLVMAASLYFITKSLQEIGFLTAATCTLFAILTLYHLLSTALRDPGIVLLQQPTTAPSSSSSDRARWCEICELFQPPDGVHCPDCNVCVAGFDHHCVWMGTCVGRNNFKQFIRFNLSWLAYLIYAIVWVTVLGPLFVTHANTSNNDNNSPAANHRLASAVMGANSSGSDMVTMMMTNGNHRSLRHVPSKELWIQG